MARAASGTCWRRWPVTPVIAAQAELGAKTNEVPITGRPLNVTRERGGSGHGAAGFPLLRAGRARPRGRAGDRLASSAWAVSRHGHDGACC